MTDKEFQEFTKQQEQKQEENKKYDELSNRMTTILCEIGNLAMEVKKLNNSKARENLKQQQTKLLRAISAHSFQYNDKQIVSRIKDLQAKAEALSCIQDEKILNEKIYELTYEWNKFLKETKETRKKVKKYHKKLEGVD